jgi:hypothetical protein
MLKLDIWGKGKKIRLNTREKYQCCHVEKKSLKSYLKKSNNFMSDDDTNRVIQNNSKLFSTN